MKSKVVIKSFPNGINVMLDPDMDFELLLDQVGDRFRRSADFFRDARVALSFEGRKLTGEEEILLIERIGQNCRVNIACLVGHDDVKNQTYLRAVQKVDSMMSKNDDLFGEEKAPEIYRDSIRENQRIEVPGNIVVLGDISAGSGIVAGGDVIVMGGAYGDIAAGCDMREGHFVAALELSPEALSIGDVDMSVDDTGNWPIKPRIFPRIAFVSHDSIVVEPISRELWKELL